MQTMIINLKNCLLIYKLFINLSIQSNILYDLCVVLYTSILNVVIPLQAKDYFTVNQ